MSYTVESQSICLSRCIHLFIVHVAKNGEDVIKRHFSFESCQNHITA